MQSVYTFTTCIKATGLVAELLFLPALNANLLFHPIGSYPGH